MSDDWGDDKEEPVLTKVSDRWEGEDDDDDVKDNWDDEDEQPAVEKKEGEKKPTVGAKGKKKLAKAIAEREAAEAARHPATAEEILSEKLAKQRLQEESDLKLAMESFGLNEAGSISRDSLDEVRKSLVDKLKVAEKSIHYVNFLDATFRDLCAALEAEDIKRLGSTLITLSNEKLKAMKATKKKKKGAAIRVERTDMVYDDDDGHEFDDFM